MTLLERARNFLRRRPELSEQTIKRTKIDESIARDMRRRAKALDEEYKRPPVLEGDEIHGGEYAGWDELLTDAFCAHVGLHEPELRNEDEITPSAEMRRRTMAAYVRSDAFTQARAETRDDPIASAFATKAAANVFRDEINGGELKEHAERATRMESVEQVIDTLTREREAAEQQGDEASDVQGMLDQAQADLEQLAEEQEDSNLRGAAASVARRAAEAGEKQAEIASRLPGNEPGSPIRVSADDAFELADRWTAVEEMWALAQMLGRTRASMRADRSTRAVGGHEEIIGLERGDDLSRVLPSELMRMRDPRTKKLFMLDWLEGDLLQYAQVGELPRNRGPVITVKDGSESMKGPRFIFATSISLALVFIAHEERRDSAVVEFGSNGQVESWVFPAHEPLDAKRICECAEHFFAGGTDIATGMTRARNIMDDSALRKQFEQADVALITDGEDRFEDLDAAIRDELRDMGVRIWGVQIAHQSEYLAEMCDSVESIDARSIRNPKNAASTFLATSIS